MSENKPEEKVKLFREKSLEAIESPEALNDYLRVTSPKVWLVLPAGIALLVGGILWGIFGRVHTVANVAVEVGENRSVCFAPYELAEKIAGQGIISVNGREYPLRTGTEVEHAVMTEDTDAKLLLAGNLHAGDLVVLLPLITDLTPGVYAGEAVVEDLQPISLLLQ